MKKQIVFLAMFCASIFYIMTSAYGANAVQINNDDIRQVLYGALDNSKLSLKNAPFGQKTIAILPFAGNFNDVLFGRLKNILTEAGFTCVEAKDDPMWNEIVKEIAWDERKSDILDPATIVKFGKLKASQILLYGKVRALDQNADRVYAEIELHATDIATKQHVWGGSFVCRLYKGKDMQGIVSLDNELRNLLKKNFEEAKKSLLSPEFAGKLGNVKTVTVIPLSGDIDQYMTGLTIEILTQTNHLPKNPQIPSLSQIRAFARDGQVASDAVFYGAVRDLRKVHKKTLKNTAGKTIDEISILYADIQLFMEDVKSGGILWSKTITLSEEFSDVREMSDEEIAQIRQEKIDAVPDAIKEDVVDNWKSYLTTVLLILGGIILLIVIIVGIKAFFSYNNIR